MIKYSKIIFILMSDYKLTLFVNEENINTRFIQSIFEPYADMLQKNKYTAKNKCVAKKQICCSKTDRIKLMG